MSVTHYKTLIIISCIIALTGCSLYSVSSEDISTDYYPSKKNITEVVYMENIDRSHEVIAYITVNAERSQKMTEIIRRMKREAAILGADVITNIKTDATGEWKNLPAQEVLENAYVRANFTASAAVFK